MPPFLVSTTEATFKNPPSPYCPSQPHQEMWVFCEQVLSSLPTTTRQDQQALAHAQTLSSFRERCLQLALQWRIQYKQSLARAFKMAQVCLAALKEG